MAYSFYSPNHFSAELEAEWNNTDTSQFMWDSPQPENEALPSTPDTLQQPSLVDSTPFPSVSQIAAPDITSNSESISNGSAPQGNFAVRPTASVASSHSSSSGSSAQRKRKASATSTPPPLAGISTIDEDNSTNDFKMAKMFEGSDEELPFEDSTYPSMGQDMHKLTLNNMSTSTMSFDFDSATTSPDPMNDVFFTNAAQAFRGGDFSATANSQATTASPEMTVQPSKTFFPSGSGDDDSSTSATMMNSKESSPSAIFIPNSPMPAANNGLPLKNSIGSSINEIQSNDSNTRSFGLGTTARSGISPSASATQQQQQQGRWPCQLQIESTPEKCRVETQIPLKLVLHNAPPGIHKLHLPSYTISKPKFQSKPPLEKSDDTLELTTMLVCASAMKKPGVQQLAFQRAARDDICIKSQENLPASTKINAEDDDPTKPLNGGPVAICSGCIVRERKRAARKKSKNPEEEEEWAKDEAKRVIVFNCAEVRNWCVPGTEDIATKDHPGPLSAICFQAPMRIACYCRHQVEKVGFQVIFTLRLGNGTIIAQAISHSIMITDDHKQPSAGQVGEPNDPSQLTGTSQFQNALGVTGSFPQPMPFRNSFSTNDLRQLGNTYSPQRHPQGLSPESSGFDNQTQSSATSTTTATPRNLSRPASPTSQPGPSTKKRRSAGSGHKRVHSGLTMTRVGNTNSTSASGSGMASSGHNNNSFTMSGGFMYAGVPFAPQIDTYQPPGGTHNPYQSGPPTPLHGAGMPAFGNPADNEANYYSAPTSQHGSRAQSPSSAARFMRPSFPNHVQIPEQASDLLSRLPTGFNLNRPPIIQRVIPNLGPQQGGDEVTVLGNGFFQGLEVMFGDNPAAITTYWGDTTLVCRSPPGNQPGMVQVMFKHQHQSSDLQQLRGLLPTQPVFFEYFDDDRHQFQMLAMRVSSQGQSDHINQMSPDELSQAFLNTSGGMSNFQGGGGMPGGHQQQQRPASVYVDKLIHSDFENLMLKWLDSVDLSDNLYQPRYNNKNERGATLLSLAAGVGYRRLAAGLLARGADPNSRDRSGYTPLMMASLRSHQQTVQLLSIKGADSNLRTLNGYTAETIAPSAKIAEFLATLKDLAATKTGHGVFRTPSSRPSLESLSTMSTSSQPSNMHSTDDSERHLIVPKTSDPVLRSLWDSEQKRPLASQDEQGDFSLQAYAALAAWREQILTQLHHLQQSVWAFPQLQMPGLPLMPSLPSLPQKINGLDYQQYYQQYPMVRRISDFLSTVSTSPASIASSVGPPAYEDIFPTASHSEENKGVSDLQAAVEARTDDKCAELFDAQQVDKGASHAINDSTTTNTTTISELPVSTAAGIIRQHSIVLTSLLPWILLLVLLFLGIWNYTTPATCTRTSAPLAHLKDVFLDRIDGAVAGFA